MDLQALVEETRRLIAIPSYEDCTAILTYISQRLPFLPWQKQYVDKWVNGRQQYNLHTLDPQRPFVVNTHVDTVPALTMREAFTPRVENDRIYGRGAVDTKGLLAALIVAVEAFYRDHGTLPVSLALTVDEENVEAAGSTHLADLLEGMTYVLVLEPTQGAICTRQKGSLEFELRIHASQIFHAAMFAQAPNAIRSLVEVWRVLEERVGLPFNIFFFQGGWEHYTTPPQAQLRGEFILEPGRHWTDVEKTILETLRNGPWAEQVTYHRIDADDPLDFDRHPGTQQVARAYREALKEKPRFDIMPVWTDAANFAKAGIPCGIFGFGDLAVAHSEREHITFVELERTARVLYKLFTILTQ